MRKLIDLNNFQVATSEKVGAHIAVTGTRREAEYVYVANPDLVGSTPRLT
jgi:hypothetical protein